jgi:hypothetical protein
VPERRYRPSEITRLRFEGIIADLSDNGAINVLVLHSARSACCNQHAVAVAIVERAVGLETVFEIGADFSLSKPVSSERAKSSFRAGGHKLKSERRRNGRVPVECR